MQMTANLFLTCLYVLPGKPFSKHDYNLSSSNYAGIQNPLNFDVVTRVPTEKNKLPQKHWIKHGAHRKEMRNMNALIAAVAYFRPSLLEEQMCRERHETFALLKKFLACLCCESKKKPRVAPDMACNGLHLF